MTSVHVQGAIEIPFDRADLDRAWEQMKAARSVAVITHAEADGDAICSAVALSEFLAASGKWVEVIYPDNLREPIGFTAVHERVGSHSRLPDLVISVDLANLKRGYYPVAFHQIPLINIDHHGDNSVGGLCLVDPTASSSCELLWMLMSVWAPEKISLSIAEPLLYGMLDDSQIFRTHLATGRTLRIASMLIDRGVEYQLVKERVRNYRAPFVVRAWAAFLKNMKSVAGKSAVLISVSLKDLQEVKANRAILGGFVNFVADLIETDIVVLLIEKQPSVFKGSFRSKRANVAKIAAKLGGGGHVNAAGFELSGSLESVEQQVIAHP